MEKSRSKNVNNSRVTHSVDPAVIEENAKKAPDGDALYREAFAKKLNELLEEKQIDQKTLAAKTKISETNISNYRNATTTIKLPALAKIARELCRLFIWQFRYRIYKSGRTRYLQKNWSIVKSS